MLRLSLDSLEFGAERFDRTFVVSYAHSPCCVVRIAPPGSAPGPGRSLRCRAARCTRERVELSLTLSNVKDQTCTVEVFNTNNITTIGIINNHT